MNPRRAQRRLLGAELAGILLLSACAGLAGPASDGNEPDDAPAAADPAATAPPTPSASGQVSAVATVLQEGDGPPVLCLGGVAESFPPQCGGPEIAGWDWDAVEADSAQGTTWGEYAVEGTWDGETFHLTKAAAAPTERPAPPEDPRLDPDNAGSVAPDTPEPEAQALQNDVFDDLDGLTGWIENGYVWVTVVYDDGSIQRYADDTYGADTVAVQSALRDVE
ncbi:hypothetical protein ACFT2C_03925 [Promicromonospora sp. NPDC057138]|uniref:hypothetical protein n=1 Tax=Promicromonospora sp. NPDC057138 TaxID=3346031 RepID=UPI0036251374